MNKGALPLDLPGGGRDNDGWFRNRMREALVGLEDGANAEIGEAEWKTIAEHKRAELRRRASKKER